MRLTTRDRLLIEELSCFGLLSTSQIGSLFFPGIRKTTCLRRLRCLEKAKLLRRVPGLPEGRLAWLTTQEGNRAVGSWYPAKTPNRNSLEHDITLANLRRSFESVGLWNSWTPEHALKSQIPTHDRWGREIQERLVPDALIVVRRQEKEELKFPTVALELELHAKNRDRYRKTLENYSKLTDLFAVWYIVPTPSLGHLIEAFWMELSKPYPRRPFLLWTLLSEALEHPFEMASRARKKPILLRDIFELKAPPPAHTLDHGVSRNTEQAA